MEIEDCQLIMGFSGGIQLLEWRLPPGAEGVALFRELPWCKMGDSALNRQLVTRVPGSAARW